MNDKIIISAISKTYFSIVSFLVFISLLLTSGFIILQNGLYLENVSISSVNAKQVYIKWDNRLDVSIETLTLTTNHHTENSGFDYSLVNTYLNTLTTTTNWFNSILIRHIHIDDFSAVFHYKHGEKALLQGKSKNITIDATLDNRSNILALEINSFKDLSRDILISGDFFLDLHENKFYSKLHMNIHNDVQATLYMDSTSKKLLYRLISEKEITDIRHTMNMLHLPKEVKYWALDAIDMSSVEITQASGSLEYTDVENAFKNIIVEANVNKLNYTYNPKLDSIHSQRTQLTFKDGVLYIRPKQAYSYGMYLDQSWLKIDFTKKEELLSLYLLFDGKLNKNMLKILNTYKIKLPFLQRKGKIATNLELNVNLHTIDVDAKGKFFTKKANFDYLGLNLDIFDANITLNNNDVSIKDMRASYKDIASADVNMTLNVKKMEGKIDFKVKKIQFETLGLKATKLPLYVAYTISPIQDTIDVESSLWSMKNKKFQIDSLSMPFDLNTLELSIPTTYVTVDDMSAMFISGKMNVKTMQATFPADILKLSYDGIVLSQSNTPITIKYDKNLSVISKDPIFFNVNGTEYKIEDLDLELKEGNIYLKNTHLDIGRYVTTKIYTKYSLEDKKAHISLSDFVLKNYEQGSTFYSKNKIMLSVQLEDENIKVNSPELNAEFILNNKEWRLSLHSLDRVARNSKLLHDLHLDNGEVVVYKKQEEKYVKFTSNVKYPYKILTTNNIPTNMYAVQGRINKDRVYLNINKQAKIKIDKDVKINLNNASLNIDELIRLIQETNVSSDGEKKKVTLKAENSSLYLSPSRKIISDKIDLQYVNSILTAQLEHAKGKAGLRFEGKDFHVYGENFNDAFMESLFSLSKFSGGKLDFSIAGNIDEYQGVFHIEDSTIIDYKILNNILAFINTVPSLVTFSLPGYNENGLYTDKAYLNFNVKNDLFHLSDIYLKSKELTILGYGEASTKKDTIKINLNLKTDLGSNLSQVPVVGYLLLDKDSVSTTLEIDGKLSDPTVKSLLAKEIVVAPFNIIKRTLMLPVKLLDILPQDDGNSTK